MTGSRAIDLLLKGKDNSVYLVKGKRGAESVWCYLSVPARKTALLEKALGAESLDTKQFGTIIFSGTGETPPEEIQRTIKEHYT